MAAPFVENTSVISRIGPNSPTAPAAEQIGAEAGAQLARVAQHRDQGSDGGGGQRRAGEQERQHEARQREQPAERIGQDERQQPSEDAKPERAAADPLEVDLVAREEEEHSEPEIREEVEELRRSPRGPARRDRSGSRAGPRGPRPAAACGSTPDPPRTPRARRRRRRRERTRCRCRSWRRCSPGIDAPAARERLARLRAGPGPRRCGTRSADTSSARRRGCAGSRPEADRP